MISFIRYLIQMDRTEISNIIGGKYSFSIVIVIGKRSGKVWKHFFIKINKIDRWLETQRPKYLMNWALVLTYKTTTLSFVIVSTTNHMVRDFTICTIKSVSKINWLMNSIRANCITQYWKADFTQNCWRRERRTVWNRGSMLVNHKFSGIYLRKNRGYSRIHLENWVLRSHQDF